MSYLKYIEKMKRELKEITTQNVVNWCKNELKKSYSETKLKNLEFARDYILKEV